ncbi:MAG: helix-turn-helix domain-containing protein [Armatimonadota bacterium]
MALRVKDLTTEEREQVRALAHPCTASARGVERAQLIWQLVQGERVPAVAWRVGRSEPRVRHCLKQFNTRGLVGLQEKPRSGCLRPTRRSEWRE